MLDSDPNKLIKDKAFKKVRFSNIIFKVELSVDKQFLIADGQQVTEYVSFGCVGDPT